MPIKLNGTDGISTTGGTAANPSIKSISYGNTSGLYFPSSNTVGIATSGVDAIRVTETQKVGIGTNTPAYTLDVAGDLRVTGDVVMSTPTGFRNRLINGDFAIWQRRTTLTPTILGILSLTTANQYTADRWMAATGANALGATIAAAVVPTATPGMPYFALRIRHDASSALSSGNVAFYQIIETINCYDLASKQVTISFKAKKGAGFNATSLVVSLVTGTGVNEGNVGSTMGTWTGWQSQPSAAIPLSSVSTSSWNTFSATFTVPAGTAEMMARIDIIGKTGTGGTTDYIDFTDVQLELGSKATQFERRLYSIEQMLCQRYYEVTGAGIYTSYAISGVGFVTSGQWKVPKRITPSITLTATNLTSGTNTRSFNVAFGDANFFAVGAVYSSGNDGGSQTYHSYVYANAEL